MHVQVGVNSSIERALVEFLKAATRYLDRK